MHRLLKLAAILVWSGMTTVWAAQTSAPQTTPIGQPKEGPSGQPIRVELVYRADPPHESGTWFGLGGAVAWPLVAIVGLLALRKPLVKFLEIVGQRATEISIGGLGIKLPTMSEAPLTEEILTLKTADAFTIVNDSTKGTLFNLFLSKESFEFALINLGRGDQWLSSRLYIFALMLQRMKSLKCVVFVAAGPSTESRFLGIATPETIRWSLARLQPWLEAAYVQAQQQPVPTPIQNEHGGIDPQTAEQLVRSFLTNITTPTSPRQENDPDWVLLGSNQQWEHSVWLSAEYVEAAFGYVLWKESVVVSDVKKEAKALLDRSAPFVAKIRKNGEFVSLINRIAFLEELAAKLAGKLTTNG